MEFCSWGEICWSLGVDPRLFCTEGRARLLVELDAEPLAREAVLCAVPLDAPAFTCPDGGKIWDVTDRTDSDGDVGRSVLVISHSYFDRRTKKNEHTFWLSHENVNLFPCPSAVIVECLDRHLFAFSSSSQD